MALLESGGRSKINEIRFAKNFTASLDPYYRFTTGHFTICTHHLAKVALGIWGITISNSQLKSFLFKARFVLQDLLYMMVQQ